MLSRMCVCAILSVNLNAVVQRIASTSGHWKLWIISTVAFKRPFLSVSWITGRITIYQSLPPSGAKCIPQWHTVRTRILSLKHTVVFNRLKKFWGVTISSMRPILATPKGPSSGEGRGAYFLFTGTEIQERLDKTRRCSWPLDCQRAIDSH